MAVGPSVLFFAPNWETDLLRSSEPTGVPVLVEPFRSWLRNRGFVQHPGPGTHFTREPIDVYVHQIDEEVVFTRIEFGVVNDAPTRISGWQTLVDELCDKWGFSLIDKEKRGSVPVEQFRRILAQDGIWRVAARVNQWPTIWPHEIESPSTTTMEPILHESSRNGDKVTR